MQGMIKRWIENKLREVSKMAPAIALFGPRQVGKTTLAKSIGNEFSALYLDLENPNDLVKLSDPVTYLSQYSLKFPQPHHIFNDLIHIAGKWAVAPF